MSSNNAASQSPGQSAARPSRSTELASLKIRLRTSLRQFPDFPSPGILFEDILPIFADPTLHEALLRSLELHILEANNNEKPDVVVGLEARGFLIGPSLALRLGASFVPVRKQGKLPGPCETQSYDKEYGQDFFQMQADAVKPGQKVIIVDDIIATGIPHSSLRYVTVANELQVARQPQQDNWSRRSAATFSALSLSSSSSSFMVGTNCRHRCILSFAGRRGSPDMLGNTTMFQSVIDTAFARS